MAGIPRASGFRRELDDVLAGVDGEADPVERIGRLGARLIVQQGLEDEVTAFLGRAAMSAPRRPSGTATGMSHGGS
jgi:hypothetical protein